MSHGSALPAMNESISGEETEKPCRTCHYLLKNYLWCYHATQHAPMMMR